MSTKPETIEDVFQFYHDQFKPLYSEFEAEAVIPDATLFEIAAALDHLSRHWVYNEPEQEVADRTTGHLKRGCFDLFKLAVKRASDQYIDLKQIDTSIIDNGQFTGNVISTWLSIRDGAKEARLAEGNSTNDWHKAFELWEPVYQRCKQFEKTYYANPKVEWARHKETKHVWKIRWEQILIGVVVGIITTFLSQWIWGLCFAG